MKHTWRQWLWKVLGERRGVSPPWTRARRTRPRVRPTLEILEDRTLPSVFPFVQSINRTTPLGPATNAASVAYTVNFNEPVTGVDPTDFQLATTGTVGTTLTQVAPVTASVYTVTISGITGSGTLGLNLADNGSIRNGAGDRLFQPNAIAAFHNQTTFATGLDPAAVAVADVNGGGNPDLVVANELGNNVSVLLGNGDGTFQNQTTFAAGLDPVAVALADLNGDGNPDVIVANLASNSVSVLLGNGNGTFQSQTTFATGPEPIAVAVADISGDGKPDLVVANEFGNSVSVLLGNGNGTFQTQSTFATGFDPAAVALADLNGDGKPDLIVANLGSNSVSVLLGNGNGTFQTQDAFATGAAPCSVAVADANGDGKPDLVVANDGSDSVSVLLGNGDGTFQNQTTFATGSHPFSVALADVSADGKPDLVVANDGSASVSVLLGNGNGTFQGQATFATGLKPHFVAVADVNGDGKLDLAVANFGSTSVSVFLNAGNGNFTGQVYTINHVAPYVAAINGSNPVSLTSPASSVTYTVTFSEPVTGVALNDFQTVVTGSLSATLTQVTPVSASVYMLTITAITGNGTLGLNLVDNGSIEDLAGDHLVQPNVPISFNTPTTYATGSSPYSVAVADVNGDGNPDLVVANRGSSSVSVLLGNGDGTFQSQTTFATGSYTYYVAVADVNGDGKPDLVVDNRHSSSVSVLLGNGNGTFQNQTTFATGAYGPMVVADVNGDGKPDLVIGRGSGVVSVLLGNGDGTFQNHAFFGGGGDSSQRPALAVADVNGDGKADLIVTDRNVPTGFSNGSNEVAVLLGNGNGTFQSPANFATGAAPSSLAVADVNGDGKPDLIVANEQSNNVSVLLGNGDGTFQSQTTFATGSFPDSVVVADVSGDGKPDLVVANAGSDSVSVLLGNGDGTFQSQATLATGSLPSSLAIADLNGNGKPDLTYTTESTNSVSVLLHAGNGDFTGQVYTIDNGDPFVQSINRSTPAGPITNATTVSYTVNFSEPVTGVDPTDFQLALTGTVAATLAQVTPVSGAVYTVTVNGITGSGTLGLNLVDNGNIRDLAGIGLVQPNAPASFQSLTTFATGNNPVSVAVADVNGDGKPDLVVANNARPGSVSVLLANGNGTFQAQTTFGTGPDDPVTVAVADVNGDGKPDLVVGNLTSPSSVSVLLGNGNGTFQTQTTFATFAFPRSVAVADMNGDGKSDLVVVNLAGVSVLLGNGNGTFQSQTTFPTGSNSYSVAVADFNGDGRPDLVVGTNSGVSVLLGNGNGTFQNQSTFATGGTPASVALGDVNGDGKPDLVVANYGFGSNSVSVLLGNGNGTFQNQTTLATGPGPVSVAVADVTGDGKPDLITADVVGNNVSVLLGNGNGTFQNQTTFATGSFPDSVVVADLSGNGKPDLIVTAMNRVGVLLNAANGNFTGQVYTIVNSPPAINFVISGTPGSIAAGSNFTFTVTAEDSANNTAAGYSGTVHFTSSDGHAVLPSDTTLVSGIGAFSATLETAGNQTLIATDTVTNIFFGSSNPIAVTPAAAAHFAFSGTPTTATAGAAFSFTIMAQDPFNNTATSYAGTVHFTSSDSQAVPPANSTLTSGVGTFSATLKTPGNQNLTAADTIASSISGTSNTILVVSGPHFLISVPSTTTAGLPFVAVVTALDQFNNTATSYAGTVHITSSDPQALIGSSTSTLTGGIGLFAVVLKTAGNQTLTATDTVTSSIFGASNAIAVTAAPATHFVVTAAPLPSYPGVPGAYPPSQSPTSAGSFASTGAPVVFTVAAEDPFGNIAPTFAGTVAFASTDTAAVLPQASTLTSGVGIFNATLATAGNQFITATDVSTPTTTGVTSAIVTRGLVVTSFTPTPTGFVINFNKPFNPSTVIMYTEGSTPDDIMLATTGSQVSIRGSVLYNSPTAPTSITFVKTNLASAVGTFNPGSGLLAAGNYSVTLRSFSVGNGFEDSLGGALDGKDQANPGVNYVYTFSVSAPPTSVGIPDFARGPSNTDFVFLLTTIGNGNTFNLVYTNPNTSPATGTATITFSTIAATLQTYIQAALNALPQIGVNGVGAPNAPVVVQNSAISTQGADVLVTFQNSYFVTATSQVLSSTTAGASIALATINAPNNVTGNGIPVALSNGQNVTSGSFTLQYNPALLTITGAVSKIAGASFTVNTTINNATSATAVLSFSSPSSISSTTASLTVGSLLATVPFSATASYGAKQLLHFSSEQLNATASSNIAVTNQDAVEVAAFFGDVNDTGMPFASSGAIGAISTVAGLVPSTVFQTLPGFTLFPDLDPMIIGGVSQSGQAGIVGNDTSLMNKQLTSGQASIPWLPAGLTVTPVGPDPTLSVPTDLVAAPDGTVIVPVNIDTARPEGSTGMVEAVLALTYDPKVFDVSAADVKLGTVPEGGNGWKLQAEVNAQAGLIGVELYSNTPIHTTAGGSLVTIAMQVRETAPVGTTGLKLVPYVDPAGGAGVYQTSLLGAEGEFVLHPAQTPAGLEPGALGLVTIAAQTPSAGGSLFPMSQAEAAVSAPAGSSAFDVQNAAAEASTAVSSALPLVVLEQVFGSLKQTAQVVQYGAFVQPRAILTLRPRDQAASGVSDWAVLQAPAGIAKLGWLSDDELAYPGQNAQYGLLISVADLLDSAAPPPDCGDLAGLEAYFASEAGGRGHDSHFATRPGGKG